MIWTEEEYQAYLVASGKAPPAPPKKKNKYNAKKVRADGCVFDSKKEFEYYNGLKLRVRAGDIAGFLHHGNMIVAEGTSDSFGTVYETDFVVLHNDGTYEIVDTKGVRTDVYKNKIKTLKNRYPNVEIKEV